MKSMCFKRMDFLMWLFLILLAVHWVADFVCQTHWQASNKSKSNYALLRHVATYTAILAVAACVLFGPGSGGWGWWRPLAYALGNGVLHFATDYCTSRWSSKLYAKQDWHNFFVVIGLDQLIHQTTLATTLWFYATY